MSLFAHELIYPALLKLKEMWDQQCLFVIDASPGSGKSTLLPLFLLQEFPQSKIIHTQPRRVATLGVSMRMADLLQEDCGNQVGYAIRMESKISKNTRLTVMTEGVLARKLKEDPELNGINVILLDEFHERSILSDLNLALLIEIQKSFRPDLKIILLTATPNPKWKEQLPTSFWIELKSRQHPIAIIYHRTERHKWENELVQILKESPLDSGSLVFLSGQREILRTKELLENHHFFQNRPIQTLYGAMPIGAQKKVLQDQSPGRIVLATNIAETSLTLAELSFVVDLGWERFGRHEATSGLLKLEDRRISRASATQRAGRAGRVRAGTCHRLWTEQEHQWLKTSQSPEILETDLCDLVLDLAFWSYAPQDLCLLDAPSPAYWQSAQNRLLAAGLLSEPGKLSPLGQKIHAWPFDPFLALLVEKAKLKNAQSLGILLAILLSEPDPLSGNSNLANRMDALIQGDSRFDKHRQWAQKLGAKIPTNWSPSLAAELLAEVFPDRIAQSRKGGAEFLMSMGRAAKFSQMDALAKENTLIIAAARHGDTHALIDLALPIDSNFVKSLAAPYYAISWHPNDEFYQGQKGLAVGAIQFESQTIKTFPKEVLSKQFKADFQHLPFFELPFFKHLAENWQRIEFSCKELSIATDFMENSTGILVEFMIQNWDNSVRAENFLPKDWQAFWYELIGWDLYQQINQHYPTHWTCPAGHEIRVDYSTDHPSVSSRLQDFYGQNEHPKLGSSQRPLKVILLSPAQRPLQVTMDLPNFWHGTYAEVRKEMKGRYPRHYWSEEPWNAVAGERLKKFATHI